MISKSKIYIIVFISGFVLMVFEIVGSRVLAPFLGSSLVVWTSLIGVILSFMSLGYWYGGKMADKFPTIKRLASVLVFAAIAILAMNLIKNSVLSLVSGLGINLSAKSLLSAAILFSIPSFLMAFVTPFAIRINISGVESSGETAGTIYALSTIGSILGTFFGGFVFVALLGTNQILWMLSVILFVLSGAVALPVLKSQAIWGLILLSGNVYYSLKASDYVDIDTDYSRILIKDDHYNERNSRFMSINGYVNSGMYLDRPNELLYAYTEFYDLVDFFSPTWKNAVMFGGAGYSYPKHFQETFEDKQLDVVEIDPALTKIAEDRFAFTASPSTRIYHEDARYFLAHTQNTYDAVLYDVLTSNLTVPFHLTTRETFESVFQIMSEEGVLVVNVIGDLGGVGSTFIQSVIKTIQEVFPQVHVFDAKRNNDHGSTNYIIVALNSHESVRFPTTGYYFDTFLRWKVDINHLEDGFVFTDNYAPANYLISVN